MLYLFILCMVIFFSPILYLAIKMSWGLLKVLAYLMVLPLLLIIAFIKGLFYVVFPFFGIMFVIYIVKKVILKK